MGRCLHHTVSSAESSLIFVSAEYVTEVPGSHEAAKRAGFARIGRFSHVGVERRRCKLTSAERAMAKISIKRIYEATASDDGCRVLVDRLWPRGLSKDKARLDHWFKDVAPSDELRHWFDHDPDKWDEFRRRYQAELATNQQALAPLRKLLKSEKHVTLLFGARDETHNNAAVLVEYLRHD